jgi:O-antigen/teichoic acid export membrane protein
VSARTEASVEAPRSAVRGRIARGFAAVVCGQGIRILGHLILVPLYLHYWSVAAFGEWLALASLTGYLSALDLGVNTAGTNRLTQLYARGDLAAYARYQASALGFYLALGGAGGLLLAVAVWRLPVGESLGLRTIPPGEAAWVAWLLGIHILLAMPVGFLSAIYRTTGRHAWSAWLGNTVSLTTFVLVPVVLGLGGGMRALAGAQLIPLLAVAGFVLWHGRRRWPALMPRLAAADLSALRELMVPSLLFTLMLLATATTLQGSVLLIVTQLGGAAVTVFVTSRTLTSLVRQVVFTVNNALWPHLTAMEATGDQRRLRLIHRLVVTGSSALAIAFAAALWQVGEDIIAMWTGGKLAADGHLLRLLLVQVVLQAPWMASSVLPLATNRPRNVALATAVSSVTGLAVAALLIGRYGLAAVPIGLIVGEALACYVFVPREACRLVREEYRRFALRQWGMVAIAAAVVFSTAWAVARVAVGPLPLRWLEVGAASLIVSLLVAWTTGLTEDERAFLAREGRASLVRLQLLGAAQRA